MRHILFTDAKKQTVRKEEINKLITKRYSKYRATNLIIDLAKKKFTEIFGYELTELPSKTGTKKSTGIYVLKNILLSESKDGELLGSIIRAAVVRPEIYQLDLAFLMVILGAIVTNNNVLDSDELFVHLGRLGFESGKSHPVYGDWEKQITKLIKQMYLTKVKSSKSSDKEGKIIYDFKVGPRSITEIGKTNILKFISWVYGEELDPIKLKEIQDEEEQDNEGSQDESPQPKRKRAKK